MPGMCDSGTPRGTVGTLYQQPRDSVVNPPADRPTVRILGTHGVPANYGGFETAAENIARYLVGRNWRVVVYCQTDHRGPVYEDVWNGVERVNISVPN